MAKKSQKAIAIDALKKISNPIRWIQENKKPNEVINGMMAIQLAESHSYLKQIAIDALRELGEIK